ncbi:E3 ubiquitin-protein ligase AIP2-like isoform X2 [Phalaenopsis equestris]|uniref:E3 ubiquitin-protein ligase AIP2-like isoform X2 n=1 Tax=Phalaenopsis equestris TaxID=78828 RepID=UPI0009E19CF6|nr:E3 ubiquitin-protein ligase AIP2-like isoform X2 [Phalaenopsis equestris]
MTSTSELFYNRRSRTTRGSETRLSLNGFPSDRDRFPIRRSFLRRRRNHFANGDDMEPSIRPRALWRTGHQPRNSNDNNLGDSGLSTGINNGSIASGGINTTSSSSNGQLPASVLQARARLLERLRGLSILQNRQDDAASSIPWDDEYWEVVVGRNSLESGRPVSSTLRQAQSPFVGRTRVNSLRGPRPAVGSSSTSLHELRRFGNLIEFLDLRVGESHGFPPPQYWIRRSPGLSSEAIHNLLHETFQEGEHGDGGMQSDCSVCLESFQEGDGLLRLHCGHRYHTACLEPWLSTCGDCPYCRARI